MTKVSIIVPVYNEENNLKACLDSLVNQTMEDMEIIVIDDNSTDKSLKIIREYVFNYPQIRAYHNSKNVGQGATRNIGLEVTNGEYIGFLDSDDLVQPVMYEVMYNAASLNDFPGVITSNVQFVKEGSEPKVNPEFKSRDTKGRLIDTCKNPEFIYDQSPSCCNKLFKRDLIGDYRFLENCVWEDIAFVYPLLMKTDTFLHIQENFYLYRREVDSGVSAKGFNRNSPLNDIFRVADEVEIQARKNGRLGEHNLETLNYLLQSNTLSEKQSATYNIQKKFYELVRLIQEAVCFRRLSEIDEWDESREYKNKEMVEFYNRVTEKYGDYKQLDDGLLSARADLHLIREVEKLSDENFDKQSERHF